MSTLDERNQKSLINDPANPNPEQQWTSQPTVSGSKPGFSKSTTSVPSKPSIKETIAAQKRAAKVAGKNLPSRPGSAEPFGSPKKSASQMNMVRPATAMSNASRNASTTSVGNLSSAPVRPRRRPDLVRPPTADPHAARNPTRTETPPRSPAVSPVKRVKTPALNSSTVKIASQKADSPAAVNTGKGNSSLSRFGFPNGTRPTDNGQPQASPTKAAEDFTMVMPNMNGSRPADFTPSTSSPRVPKLDDPFSPTPLNSLHGVVSPEKNFDWNDASSDVQPPRLSPSKLAGELGRLSFNEGSPQKISMSPRAIGSRKENQGSKSPYTQDQRPLKVYEDPVHDSISGSSYPSPLVHIPRALEELPINEPVKNRQTLEHQLLAEDPQSPEYHRKWLATEVAERRHLGASENVENPRTARKILDSGIDRIRARSLDVHGFRKLQTLIRTSGVSIWEEGYKFDELILPLLEYLEIPSDETTARAGKAQDLTTQKLVTVKLLLQHQPQYFSGYYPRALKALLTARRHYNSTSHIVCGLEETAESIVHQCEPLPCIESVLDLLEENGTDGSETNTISMGLYVLAGLLHDWSEKGSNTNLSEDQESRLGATGVKYLSDTNPDIRRAVIEYVLELHDAVDHDRFWGLVADGRDDHRSLITYYMARKRAIAQ